MLTGSIPQGSLLPPWAQVRDATGKLPSLVGLSDCYPLQVTEVGSAEVEHRGAHL